MIGDSKNATLGSSCRVLLVILFTFLGCAEKKKSSPSTATKPSAITSDTNAVRPVDNVTKTQVSGKGNVAGSDTWQYSNRVDKEGRTVYKASITSPKLLEFEFPYSGGSVATLTLRKRESDTHVYIQVSKGQFNRSFQGGNARVRFDSRPPVKYAFSAAENGSANVIFFDSEKEFIRQLKASRNMTVDVEFAGQGTRQITFRIANLTWNY
ncbi:hypothetical protein GCM10027592_36110 [Spirosoma flavus]